MKYDFAALRFTEDGNLADRTYWYLCEFPVKAGEGVLAPVGAHNRLQFARVERTVSAPASEAPYDLRYIKRIAAPAEKEPFAAGRVVCFELGGNRYDPKHYTQFHRILYSDFAGEIDAEERELLRARGITQIVAAVSREEIPSVGCVLLVGADARRLAAEILFRLRAGESDPLTERLK